VDDKAIPGVEVAWSSLSGSAKPATESQHIQRGWNNPVAKHHKAMILTQATTDIDKARLLAAASPHSGDWLAAPPITSVGLRLSDDEVRVAVAHRLGYTERVNPICADVASWSTHGVSTAWPVGEAHQDNSVTAI